MTTTIAVATRYSTIMQKDEVIVPLGRSEKAVRVFRGGYVKYHPNERRDEIMQEILATRAEIKAHAHSLIEKCLESMKERTRNNIKMLVEKRAEELRTTSNKIKVDALLKRKGVVVISLEDEVYS